jgi:Fic family protein
MQKAFTQIDTLAQELKSLQPLKDEYQKKLDKKFRLEFNYNSNHIEGNTLTYSHTELLLIFDQISGDYKAREIEEMKAHDVALTMIGELANDKERDLTESFIRQLNEIILVRPFWKEAIAPAGQPTRRLIEPGTYKEFPNSVRLENGEMFDYASPEETSAMMHDLMNFYHKHAKEHPIWQAAMVHYKFVCIHPFDDGNGRVSRLLMNYILFKNNLPPVIIKAKDKKGYITALNKADTGDLDAL